MTERCGKESGERRAEESTSGDASGTTNRGDRHDEDEDAGTNEE
jgi:hypothetical protein